MLPESDRPGKSILREYYEALVIALIFVNFLRMFLLWAYKIPTGSMIDSLLVGDHIIVNKYAYGAHGHELFGDALGFREVRRGDIAVFRYPVDPHVDFIKRVIGLPGDVVEIRDKKVLINGSFLPEPYVIHQDPRVMRSGQLVWSRDQFGPFRVPPDQYFMMGDNRDRSNDSRYWGPVPRSLIKGKAFLVYWSYRGKPPASDSSAKQRARELWAMARTFISHTRWDRTFFVIDSRYHYHPEPEPSGGS